MTGYLELSLVVIVSLNGSLEALDTAFDAPRINKSKASHKRVHHFLTSMGSTIFSIGVSLMGRWRGIS